MRYPKLSVFSLLLLAGLLLAGCRAAAPATPTPAPTFPPPKLALEGTWMGKTDQDKPVVFVIKGSNLTMFTLNYGFDTCTKTIFSINAPGIGGIGRYTDERTLSVETPQLLKISFMSDSSAQGSFDFDSSQGLLAASCQPGRKQTIMFSATKQASSGASTAPAP
jgi:hypothetical protein